MLVITSSIVSAATYTNSKSFDVKLPHDKGNATAATAKKASDRDYGKIVVKDFDGGTKGIRAWLQMGYYDTIDVNGPIKTIKASAKGDTIVLYYTLGNKKPKGHTARLRVDNLTDTSVVRDSAQGTVWLN